MNISAINSLVAKAQAGDQSALTELQNENKKMVNKISKRISMLKSHGIDKTPATEALFGHVDKLTTSKKLSLSALRNQLIYGSKFLDYKTSSYTGYKKYTEKNLEQLHNLGLTLTPEEFSGKWADFMATDYFQELKKFDSERALLEAEEATRSGITLQEVKDAWQDYSSGRKTFFEALQSKFKNE